jgi:hypothetical protein
MSDESLELPLAEKLAIARSFIQLSPPGQTQKVVQGALLCTMRCACGCHRVSQRLWRLTPVS